MPAGGARQDIYNAVGYSGLPRWAGFVYDEFLLELQGPRGRRVFREMADNSATVGALLFAITMLCRRVEWSIRPDEAAPEEDKRHEFVDSALGDMVVPWHDRLSEILSFLPYGWGLHEQIYKKRDGKNSKYSDGKIGWYDWPLRGQETLLKWEFDDAGGVLGMWQLGPPDYREVFIPMSKALLFRTSVTRGSPEGKSILRNAYRSWYFLKNIEIFEGIGIERDLAGLPYLRVPGQILEAQNNPNATPQDQMALTAYQEMVRQVRVNEGHGIILPSDVDPESKTPMYEFSLLTSGGEKQFDTNEIINRLKLDITQTVLADFLQVGHESQGSHALAEAKVDLFSAALRSILHMITSVVNDVAIPRLLTLNGMSSELAPQLVHGDIDHADLDALGGYILHLSQAGFQLDTSWDGNLLKEVLQKAGLPEPPEEMPAVLNEPVTVYEQATDQTPTDAAAAMPPPGKRRMPQRPGQPAQTPAPSPQKASESPDETARTTAAAALIIHATRRDELAAVLHKHMADRYLQARNREAKRHGAPVTPIAAAAATALRTQAQDAAGSIADTYDSQVQNAKRRGEDQQAVDDRRATYKPAAVLAFTGALAARAGMLDFYGSPEAADTPTAAEQMFHVEPGDAVCEICQDLVDMGSVPLSVAEGIIVPAHDRCPHEIVAD